MGDEDSKRFKGGLAPPQYKGPGTPVGVMQVEKLVDKYDGKVCCMCKGYADPKKAREEIDKDNFWQRAFGQYKDGHDFKPWMFGDRNDYSICERLGIVTSAFATCPEWKEKNAFLKSFARLLGKKE